MKFLKICVNIEKLILMEDINDKINIKIYAKKFVENYENKNKF